MRGLSLAISIFASVILVGVIQEINMIAGSLLGAVLIALHFFIIALYFTRGDYR